MVLRAPDHAERGDGRSFDVEVLGLQGQRYVDVVGENRLYRGELGPPFGRQPCFAGVGGRRIAPPRPRRRRRGGHASENAWVPERTTEQAPPRPPSEPVSHPFPLPPSEPSDFVPHHLAPHAARGTLSRHSWGLIVKRRATNRRRFRGPKPDPLAPIWQVPLEPVHHPFPLPPSEPSEFDPALTAHSLPFSKPAPKRLCRKSQAKRRMQLTRPATKRSRCMRPTPRFRPPRKHPRVRGLSLSLCRWKTC